MRNIMDKGSIKAAVDKLVLDIENMTDDEFKNHLKSVRQFHNYSFCNIILILHQLPVASIIASCKKWNALERSIKRGEKAIRILAPTFRKVKNEKVNDKGDVVVEEDERIGFIDVPVFDISQTEGKALPELKPAHGSISKEAYDK